VNPRFRRCALVAGLSLIGAVLLAACNSFATPTQSRLAMPVERQLALEIEASELCRARRGAPHLPPHHFTTDGCSMWPDGNWQGCCVRHDEDYWCGGDDSAREASDQAFRQCVTETDSPLMASVMYWGVRAGGAPMLPVPWRWGYGWDWSQHGAQDGKASFAPEASASMPH